MHKIFTLFIVIVLICTQSLFINANAKINSGEETLISEDFEDDSYQNNWLIKTTEGSRNWMKKVYNENHYMQMSGYKATDINLETYLISPEINFDLYEGVKLSFKTKNGFYRGTTLTVWVSTDFDGANVSTATWIQLQAAVDERDNHSSFGDSFVATEDVALDNFSGKGYIAFKYKGNKSSLTTTYQVDDVVVKGTPVNFSGTLSSTLTEDKIEFPYVKFGQESEVKSYTLNYTDVSGNISIQSASEYFLSQDGSNWSNALSISTGNGTGTTDIKVKFVPQKEYFYGTEKVIEHTVNNAFSYEIKALAGNAGEQQDAGSLNKEQTLDVVTWNLEFFGISDKETPNQSTFNTKLTKVSNKIIELDADVYALQEIIVDDLHGDFLTPLVDKLNELVGETKYASALAPAYSFYFNNPSKEFPSQRICFVYNLESISNLESFSIFSDFYDGYSTPDIEGYPTSDHLFWAAGRLPQMMKAIVTIEGESQLINFVNIHAKCCDNGAERRAADAAYLYNELKNNYNDDYIVILGDYNETYSSISGAYAPWYEDDNINFLHVAGSYIDHVSVSNELYYEYYSLSNNTQTDKVNYSDHDPVMVRLLIDSDKQEQTITLNQISDQQVGSSIQLEGEASSGLSVKYVLVSGRAQLTDDMLEIQGAGEIIVQAVQEGNEQYAPAFSELVTINVAKAEQTITFDPIQDITFGIESIELTAISSSNLDVTYEVVSGNATIEGNVLTITGAGQVTVRAKQGGNNDYGAATDVSVTFNILKADQAITFDDISDKIMGDDSFELTATSDSGLPVVFEVVSGGISIEGNVVTLIKGGEAVVKATQSGNENYNAAPEVTKTFNIEEKNGIEDEYARQVNVFPNPSSNYIRITTPDVSDKEIRLIDLTGGMVKQLNKFGDAFLMRVNDLPEGLYFIQITSGNITIAKKIRVRK